MRTPNRFPGTREQEEFRHIDDGYGDPGEGGASRYHNGNFRLRDAYGVFNPRNKVFGEDYLVDNNDNRATTTLDTPLVRVSLTLPDTTGKFLIFSNCQADADKSNVIIDLYNSTDASTITASEVSLVVGEVSPITFMHEITLTGTGKVIQLRWYNPSGVSKTLGISYATIAAWKVP